MQAFSSPLSDFLTLSVHSVRHRWRTCGKPLQVQTVSVPPAPCSWTPVAQPASTDHPGHSPVRPLSKGSCGQLFQPRCQQFLLCCQLFWSFGHMSLPCSQLCWQCCRLRRLVAQCCNARFIRTGTVPRIRGSSTEPVRCIPAGMRGAGSGGSGGAAHTGGLRATCAEGCAPGDNWMQGGLRVLNHVATCIDYDLSKDVIWLKAFIQCGDVSAQCYNWYSVWE